MTNIFVLLAYLIECAAHRRSDNETQTEKGLEAGEGRGYIVWELFSDNGEAGRKEGRVAHRLHDPNYERENYEGIMAVDLVQQTEENRASPSRQDAAIEEQLRTDTVQLEWINMQKNARIDRGKKSIVNIPICDLQ